MNALKIKILDKTSIRVLTILVLILFGVTATFAQTPVLRTNGKIAFTSDRDGNREIYVMNADGTNQVRLTNNLVVDDHPTWSPDGTKIAFVSQRANGGFAIFVMNADGTNKVEVTSLIFNATFPISDAWGMSWSPDGNRIVFQELDSTNDIFLVDIDGRNRQILLGDLVDDRQPSWSPDGSKILFSRNVSQYYYNLFTIRPDGTDLQPLASNAEETDLSATWSPAGDKVAFQLGDENAAIIAIANADGSNRFLFDNGGGNGGCDKPDWSPDGSKIVFHVRLPLQGGTQIYVKNVDGTGLTPLTNLPGNNFKPSWQSLISQAPAADFDGDRRSDISVFRPADRVWYLNRSTLGFSATQFGLPTDKITPADFDGDGKTDISVFRDGTWYWLSSSNNNLNAIQFGLPDDIPVPADYTGDGRAELAVYRGGNWFTLNLANNQVNTVQFGISNDKPVVGDYDGDGRADYAVYRDGTWYLLRSSQDFTSIQFGLPTDKLVPADYDGDGKTDQAVYRDGTWYLLRSQSGFTAFQFGLASDIPAPADYDGDGKTDAAVYRDGIWHLRQSTAGTSTVQFGLANDRPIPSTYIP